MRFSNRVDAGQRLADRLAEWADRGEVTVLGLPRGGVPVAFEVARRLRAPLDVLVVRKLGTPGQPELAMGAVASGGVQVLHDDLIRQLDIPPGEVARVAARARAELERRERDLRGGRPLPDVRGRVVILVDDGAATGATTEAAVRALRVLGPARVIVAVPVAAPDACARLRAEADQVVCLSAPSSFSAVGQWYDDFSETTDADVRALLSAAAGPPDAG